MNILIVGLGAESYEIRARQIGAALHAKWCKKPRTQDLQWADAVVLIKRAGEKYANLVHQADKPLVWDALDYWKQPDENHWTVDQAQVLSRWIRSVIRPTLTIGATQAMADAHDGVYLPHHARPDMGQSAPREVVKVVAYEGIPKYLGVWRSAIDEECRRRGWNFIVNPPHLCYADIIVAFRDGPWDGWMCREWKSGVKIVNAMAIGRPIITQASAAFRELTPLGTTIESIGALSDAFDQWAPLADRKDAAKQRVDRWEFNLANVAQRYYALLQRVVGVPA